MNPRAISPANQKGQENDEIKRVSSKSPEPSNREHSRSREGALFSELQVNIGLGENASGVLRFEPHEEAKSPKRKSVRLEKKKETEEKRVKQGTGHWTKEEHLSFIKGNSIKFSIGVQEYGRKWELVKKLIPTRTTTQVRAHAQKFFNKIDAIKPANIDTVKYIRSRKAEDLQNIRVARQKNSNPNSDISPSDRPIPVHDMSSNYIPREAKVLKDVLIQTEFDLPATMSTISKKCEVVLQTSISNRVYNEVFNPKKRKLPYQAPPLSSHRERERESIEEQAHAEFVQQELNVPEEWRDKIRTKDFHAQTMISFASKTENETQTDLWIYVPIFIATISKCLSKLMERLQELPLICDIDSKDEPEKFKKREFLIKSSEKLLNITLNVVMAQQQSIQENGLLPDNFFY